MSKLMSRRPRLYTRRLSSRLFVRNLEDRTVPAAFLVNANTDIGAGSGFAGDLRFCIEQANALPGPDTITFDPSVTLVGLSGIELVISDSLTIIGNGSGSTTIDALGLSRIFKIDDSVAGSSINVFISGLTLTNGKGLNNAVADRGGAVLVQDEIVSFNDVSFVGNAAAQRGGALALAAFPGKVTVTKSSFVNNFTTGSNSGGAINVVDGQLDISSSTLTGNTASLRGGAIYQTGLSSIVTIGNSTISNNRNTSLGGGALTVLNGTLTISDSAVSGNTSSGRGGAVYALANGSVDVVRSTFSGNRAEGASTQNGGAISGQSAARVTILESTLSGNTALGRGGAVYTNRTLTVIDRSTILNNSAGTLGGGVCMIPFSINAVSEIRNSTFTGNIAQTNGGGIALYITYGITRIQNCTIVGNTANGSGGGLSRTGFGPSRLLLDSNIIANNTNANAPDFNGGGNTAANSVLANNNLIFSPTGNGVITGTGNIFSVDPDLGPLQNNGGLTQTFKPNPTSPVINAGLNPASAAATDQTGATRSFGQTDIGAVEVVDPGTPVALPVNLRSITTPGATRYTLEVTYTGIDTATLDNSDVRVTGPNGYDQLATLRGFVDKSGVVTATYTVPAPGGVWDDTDIGFYTASIEAGQVGGTGFVPAGPLGQFAAEYGRSFVVTSAADSGPGTLRQALADAALTIAPDTITFDPSLAGTTVTLTSPLTINSSVSIKGLGQSQTTISGNSAVRIFLINAPGQATVSLSDMTLTKARSTGNLVSDRGGAIAVIDESVTITNVAITGNTLTASRGAAIALAGQNGSPPTVTINNSVISANSASLSGGAINIAVGFLTINESTLANNTSGNGGAIYMETGTNTSAALNIFGSTLSANTAGTGGALTINSTTTTTNVTAVAINVRNSTISGNKATGTNGGGGIFLQNFGNTLKVQNSTLAFNTATGTGGGGGVHFFSPAGTPGSVTVESSIVANNSATVGPDFRTSAAPITANNSLFGSSLDLLIGSGTGNITDVDPLLAPLANNGGPTLTHALKAGSPAIDTGSNPANLTTDQRGAGFARVNNAPDMGAYEVLPTVAINAPAVTSPGGTSYSFTVVFSDENGIDATTIDAGDMTVTTPSSSTIPLTLVSVTPAGNGNPRTATYSFTPPGGTWDAADLGTYTVAFTGSVSTTLGVPVPTGAAANLQVVFGRLVTVTSLADSGPGTLRQAILDAATVSPAVDTITFDGSLSGTISLGSELLIDRSIVIQGTGTSKIVIDGNKVGRVFNIDDGDASKVSEVTISKLTITNGSATGDGGGIFIDNENVTLDNVVVSNNTTDAQGGGIAVDVNGSLVLRNSTVSGNAAPSSGGMGGGIYFLFNGDLTIENSTINGNSAGNQGGGVYFFGTATDGTLNIRNSTISGNNSKGDGGGVIVRSFLGNLLVENSTIANNTSGGNGGGITRFNTGTGGTVTLSSTIVANNSALTGPDVGTLATANYSLVSNTAGSLLLGGSNRLNVDPLLVPLANNGGPTQTHALKAGSPALNFGFNPAGLTTDQRGSGFARQSGTGVDIGAFEEQVPATPAKVTGVVINNGAAQRSRVTSLKVSFSQPVSFADISKAFTLNRVSDSASVTLNTVLDGSGTFVTITFTGGAVDGANPVRSLADGRYTLVAVAGEFTGDGLDGDGNGTAGDNFVFGSTPFVNVGNPATGIFRLFGDANGNGQVGIDDFLAFRLNFLSSNDAFDNDGNGSVDAGDFLKFRLNFLAVIS